LTACTNCGTGNEATANFCIQCGARQVVTCSVCAQQNPAAARFCANCGSSLAGLSPIAIPVEGGAAPTSPHAAERRLVSVLFADLVGSTALAEDRDPEETRELLTQYFDVARQAVERHGGMIEKFIGDAVMALWGAPIAYEDDAERAVRAALELIAAVPQIEAGGQPLRARAAVLTGDAAVTMDAQGQGMVAGDLVNTASRLQSVAAPGTVLVGEATYRAAATAVSFEPAGEQLLKGKQLPFPAWRAVAVVATRGGERRDASLEPPFIGRDDELQQLKDQLAATTRESRPRLVTVIGQPGVGKSRLAWEFEKYLDGVVDDVYWHEGRSPSYGEGVSYWALAEMVRRRAGIAEHDEPAIATPKLLGMLEEFVPDETERRWIQPRLAGLLGIAELPPDGREELFAAWRTLFQRIADRGATVLVFSDLHWADQGLLDFVEDLLTWSRSSPILVLALARPELLERRPTWGSGVRTVTRINLEPLTDAHMRDVLDGLLPGLPDGAASHVVRRAEGIPLYAVETVRMLLDSGAVVPGDDGRHGLSGDLTELAVPETLQALIAARLDGNPPEDRALLQDASVLGQSFRIEALAAVSDAPLAVLETQLERLARRQFLMQDVDPRSPERGQFRFVQGLFREVAYQSLTRGDRRSRHVAAARFFESLGEEELSPVVASHYLDAYRSSTPGAEADALAAQARVTLLTAADRASSLHSYEQAMAYLELALTVTTDPADRARTHERIAAAGEPAGTLGAAAEHAEMARSMYQEVGDDVGVLRAGTWLGRVYNLTQQEAASVEALERAIADAAHLGDIPELAEAYGELARVHMLADRHDQAVVAADRALATRAASVAAVIEALVTKGTSLLVNGRPVEAEATLRGAIHLADRHGLIAASVRARNNLSGPHAFANLAEAQRLLDEGYEMAVRFGYRPMVHQFLFNQLETAWRRGEWDAWIREIDEAEESESASDYAKAGFYGARAQRLAARGKASEAERLLERATALGPVLGSAQLEYYAHMLRAWLRLMEGRWSDAALAAWTASANTNFTVEAWYVASIASVAGGMTDRVDAVIAGFRQPPFPGPVSYALAQIAAAGLAARRGAGPDADSGFRAPHRFLLDSGDVLFGHLAGLLWSELAGDRNPDAAAAGTAADAFFAERGASGFPQTFRERFVRAETAAVADDRLPAAQSRT
jgi:class 3 adenylate cyclase/tetratricopeptide (TPR) repeat protein